MVQRWLFSGTANSPEPGRPQLDIKISFPRRSLRKLYVCIVELGDGDQRERVKAYGVDTLQAISMAKVRVRMFIESFGAEYRFGLDRYQTMFPLIVPSAYGTDVEDEVEAYIRTTVEREENRMTEKFRNKNSDDAPDIQS